MSVRLQMDGLREFREALRQLPEALADEASAIVLAHAEQAQRFIRTGYPEGPTGNLKRGVTLERNRTRITTQAVVRSRARHAHLFERGTGRRQTAQGYNRGQMPEAPESQRMIPQVIRRRAQMERALADMLRRNGFEVSG